MLGCSPTAGWRYRLAVSTLALSALAVPACAAQVPQSVMASTTTIPIPPVQAALNEALKPLQVEPAERGAADRSGPGDSSTTMPPLEPDSIPTSTMLSADPAEPVVVEVADVRLDGVEVVSAQRVESSYSPPYEITTMVPALVHYDEAIAGVVNAAIDEAIVAPVELFRSDMEDYFGGLTAADVDPSSFTTDFEVTYLSNELLSLRFRFENRIGGFEIPTIQLATVVFDLATGERIHLDDAVGADNLPAIADLVAAAVVQTLYDGDPEAFAPWAPSIGPDYLGSFAVAPEGLQFSFSQYEVGPDFMGAPVVVVPYADILDLLDPTSVVARALV